MGIGRGLVPLLLATVLLAGCAEKPEDCSDEEVWHQYESRCADANQPWEICNAYFSGTADNAVACAAKSTDGRVWLDISLQGLGSADIQVTNPSGTTVFERAYTANAEANGLEFSGPKGSWILDVDFHGAQGSALIVLYG